MESSPAEAGLIKSPLIRCSHAAQVDPRLLRPNPLNPNRHPPKQIEMFITILGYSGWRRPITVSRRSGLITKGHGAYEAALEAGYGIVPVDYQDYDDEAQELADMVADNALQHMSELEEGKLIDLLVKLDTGDFNMVLTGLELPEMEKMLASVPGYHAAADEGLSIPQEEMEEAPQNEYASETQTSGGPAEAEPYSEGLPEPQRVAQSHVRMIQLFFNEETVSEFMTIVEHFQRRFEVDNTTDAVLMVLRGAYASDKQTE